MANQSLSASAAGQPTPMPSGSLAALGALVSVPWITLLARQVERSGYTRVTWLPSSMKSWRCQSLAHGSCHPWSYQGIQASFGRRDLRKPIMPEPSTTTRQSWLDTCWLTARNSQGGYTDHVVLHEELATRAGAYVTICGLVVYPAALIVPSGQCCTRCTAYRHASMHHGRQQHRDSHKPGWLARLLGHDER
jgi:hypothetical protein